MTKTFTQVPPDSTGDKLDMMSYPRGADTVHAQGVYNPGLPSFRLLVESGVGAANKYHIYLGNNTGSAQTLYVTSLHFINLQTAAITGVINRFNLRRVTGTPTLTSVTSYAKNSADTALANVTSGHTVTAGLSDSTIILPLILSSEEQTAVPTNTASYLQHLNLLQPMLSPWERPFALRPNEALAVKQVDAGAVGSFAWIMDFAVEPD
jgi:hypothetical protein